jgi:hypothetical protein
MNKPAHDKKEQRRFPRVFLQNAEAFNSLVGAKAVWPGGQLSEILDLSYTGAAVAGPAPHEIEKGETVELEFQFAGQKSARAQSKVIRNDGKIIGVQFSELDPRSRLSFENFMNDNLLGLNLRQVDPGLFSQNQDFTHWFHGPKDTNVFVWESGRSLQKAIVEIDHQILVWNQGVLSQGKSRGDLNSAIDDYYSPVLYESLRAGESVDQKLLSRVVKILSQAAEPNGPLSRLLGRLKDTGPK